MTECFHPFAVFLAGGDSPYWRKLLREGEAPHVGINFKSLSDRMGEGGEWSVADHFPGDVELMADGGRSKDEEFDHDSHVAAYQRWVGENIDRLSLVIEYEGSLINREWRRARRLEMLDIVPVHKFLPIWREADGADELEALSRVYPRVAIVHPSSSIEGRVKSIALSTGVKLHGLGITGPDDVGNLPLVTTSSTSWISPTHYGDAHIWAGGRFHWYPKRSAQTAISRHSIDIDQAGFDSAAYARGERKEVARYTIWAWKQYEAATAGDRSRLGGSVVTPSGPVSLTGSREGDRADIDTTEERSPHSQLVRRRPQGDIFPGLALRQEVLAPGSSDDVEPPSMVTVAGYEQPQIRACSSCYLSNRCPAYDPGASCSFKMPIEIRTRPQVMGSLAALLEMQFARVVFARAAEEADGSVVNVDTSAAIAQYVKMVETIRNIEGDPSFFRIEGRGPKAVGILTELLRGARGNSGATVPVPTIDPQEGERIIRNVIDATAQD